MMIKWNLDQAWAWFVLRDENAITQFADNTITAHNWYCADHHKLTKENAEEFCTAILKKNLTAWIGKTSVPNDDWKHYKIKIFTDHRSCITDGIEDIEGITFFSNDVMRVFPKEPIIKDFTTTKTISDHKIAYEQYLSERIEVYLKDKKLKRPYESWTKEESILKDRIGSGYNRDKFKNARTEIIKKFPYHDKKNLSCNDSVELREFITERYSKIRF